jgi:gas vesicle protein
MANSSLPYFLFGLGVGAAAGILFAPKSGEETRDELRRRAEEGREYLKRRGSELREQAGEAIDRSREAVHSQREQLSAALEAGRRAYRETTGQDPTVVASGLGS